MPSQYATTRILHHLLLLSTPLFLLASGQTLSLLTPNFTSVPDDITIFEWTAMGDSYASGIGAGALPQTPDPDKCFRCSNAYPELLQSGPGSLQPIPERFNFVACSGAKTSEIIDHQLSIQDRPGRPAWGRTPQFVTITMGGNDVGILYLVLTCIYSVPITGKGCDALIQQGFDALDTEEFNYNLYEVLYLVRRQGKTSNRRNFHIFVTGYAQLFNSETTQCNEVTFGSSRLLLTPQFLTQARRARMNALAVALNRVLQRVVARFPAEDVTYVDYDMLFEGHRFCDRVEPSPNDDETWFFQLGTTSDPINRRADLQQFQDSNETENAVARSLLRKALPRAGGLVNSSSDDTITGPPAMTANLTGGYNAMFSDYFRVFHPKSRGHQAIQGAIHEAINRVLVSRGAGAAVAHHDTS